MPINSWDTPPKNIVFAPNEIHIWRVQLDRLVPQLESIIACLSEEELTQGRRFVKREHSNQFLISHAVLRLILSRYMNMRPESIRFQKGHYGKPFLDHARLQFNMTHSNDVALYAFSEEAELGIDVEYLAKECHTDALVKRFFSKKECEAFQSIPEAERRLAFYRGWTRKEAYLKATGLGLSFPLDQFDVSFSAEEEHALLGVNGSSEGAREWRLFSFEAAQNYVGSIAVRLLKSSFITYEYKFV